ncbi:phosphotransferase family protein [Nocardia sp. NPDC059239]|uniref:phosphotransferase family protein n=1 Tax=unclassified Nocardia TaxID=2637762 RepID=UPI0036C5F0CB
MALANTLDASEAQARLADWLAGVLPHVTDLAVTDVVVPQASGISNQTVLFAAIWTEDGRRRSNDLVARLFSDGLGVLPSYPPATEYAVLTALRSGADVGVPGLRWFEPDNAVLGGPFLVMDRVPGRTAADDPPFTRQGWVLDLSEAQRRELNDNALRALVRVHQAPPEVLDDVPGLHRGLSAQLALYEDFYDRVRGESRIPTIDAGIDWVRDNLPDEPETLGLSWGDARLGNLLFADDLSVAAVLDWEMVGLGAPEQDLGWWLFFNRHHTDGIGAPLPSGLYDRDETIARYEELAGRTVSRSDVDFYEAFAALRTSVMMVRAAAIMAEAGLLPPENTLAASNPMLHLLSVLTGVPAPSEASSHFIGNR